VNQVANSVKTVLKKDGSSAPFDVERVVFAIERAGRAVNAFDRNRAIELASEVLEQIPDCEVLETELIQDVIEEILAKNHFSVSKAYILYRAQHAQLREDSKVIVNAIETLNEYIDGNDWRINANANQGYSLGGLILNVSGKMTANYWLSHVYSPEIGEAHREGALHIHDLDLLTGYCAGWSLRTLLSEGFNGVSGKVEAKPPKHFSSAVGQIVNFLGTLQNEWAGAQALSSFDTYMAPFIRKEGLSESDVKQQIQELIFNLNVPSRWGTQTPFTNLTFDWVCPKDLREQHPIIGGTPLPFCYGDLQVEMDMINRAYIEVMMEGDAKSRVFTFPIPTYNITSDFPWESANAELLFEMTAKYGLPYFQNFVNSELDPGMIRSMCCRLQLDLRELLKRGNGLFGSAEQTGSLGVVTVNCARLGYLHRGSEEKLYNALDCLLILAKDSLEIKRKMIQKWMDNDLYPFTKRFLGTLRNHFSTIGVNGINEMIRNFTYDQEDITTSEGVRMAGEFLDHILQRITQFQEKTGHLYNLEATPAEGATYRFAKEDKKRFPGILQAGTPSQPYYTNSSQLPVGFTDDPFEALSRQEPLQKRYTGGTVLHLYMSGRLSSIEACKRLVRRSLEKYSLPYITVTPTFSICPSHGYLSGEHKFCPKCDEKLLERMGEERPLCDAEREPCEIWTRVMGYHRPLSSFNIGKKGEHNERTFFEENRASI